MAATRQAVLLPNEGALATMTPEVRGGKGLHLAELVNLGLPVPPFFTIPTGISRAFNEHGQFPNRFWWHLERAIEDLEKRAGRKLDDPLNPLLVSVRSGAPVSMPGMMDTFLNVGLQKVSRPGLIAMGGRRFARDIFKRHREQQKVSQHINYGYTREGSIFLVPEDQNEIIGAIVAVIRSWFSERAVAYRTENQIPGWVGTAINVQAMVYGNLDDRSGTGVVFSSDPSTGKTGMVGEWLQRAQGEDIVSGKRTPQPIKNLANLMPDVYDELNGYVEMLAETFDAPVDVEFTVESGQLYILQVRKAKLSPLAAATIAVRRQWAGELSREQAVECLSRREVRTLQQLSFSEKGLAANRRNLIGHGLAASPGAAVGVLARTSEDAMVFAAEGKKVVLYRPDTSPSDLQGMLVSSAIVTEAGGSTCHAAVVARAHGIPAVVGVQSAELFRLANGDPISVDANSGQIYLAEIPLDCEVRTKEVNIFLKWVLQQFPEPVLNFQLLKQYFSANQIANDFYLSSMMAKDAVGSKLEARAAEIHRQVVREAAEVFAVYLTVAVAGELRHSRQTVSPTLGSTQDQLVRSCERRFGATENMRSDAQYVVTRLIEKEGLQTGIEFAELATAVFLLEWADKGYGGSAWAEIASTLHAYLNRDMSAEVFVDHVFDLKHNGGILFNKHSVFRSLSDERELRVQLDMKKRARTIRELLMNLRGITYFSPEDSFISANDHFGSSVRELFHDGVRLGIW